MSRPPRKPKPQQRPSVAGWESRLAAAELLHLTMDAGADLDTALDKSKTVQAPRRT
jgi:hypothetical protein